MKYIKKINKKNKLYNLDQLNILSKKYDRDGYILLKNCIPKLQCSIFFNTEINKLLKKHKIDIKNKKTYRNKIELSIKNKNNECPLSNYYSKWDQVFNNEYLINFLNKIHRNKWSFYSQNLGWIHVRFPYYKSIKPKYYNNWHIDGINNSNFIYYNQGEVILPMITNVSKHGGGTVVLPGSHKSIENYIHSRKNTNIHDKIYSLSQQFNKCEITCNAGDILIMNPYLIHGSSYCNKKNKFRCFFNICLNK